MELKSSPDLSNSRDHTLATIPSYSCIPFSSSLYLSSTFCVPGTVLPALFATRRLEVFHFMGEERGSEKSQLLSRTSAPPPERVRPSRERWASPVSCCPSWHLMGPNVGNQRTFLGTVLHTTTHLVGQAVSCHFNAPAQYKYGLGNA